MPVVPRPHLTVLRAPSAVRLVGEAETVLVKATSVHGGDGYMRISNAPHRAEWHLRFEVHARAAGLEEAQEQLGSLASRFAVGLGLAANAAIGMLDLTACYCTDATGGPRQFARDALYDTRAGSISPRDLDGDLGAQTAAALFDANERADRAAWHFVRALDVWDPRLLAPSAGHLWIAAETLGPVVEDLCVAEQSVADWKALAVAWGLTADREGERHAKTTNEAIVRKVFGGDRARFKDLRELANGWEHGYRSFGTIRERAKILVDDAARTIRAGLLDIILGPGPDRVALADPRFDAPVAMWSLGMRLGGTVAGPPEVFAPLAEPIEPQAAVTITAAPAEPPKWRTLKINLNIDAREGHSEGVLINFEESTVIAPSGRPADAHEWEDPQITRHHEEGQPGGGDNDSPGRDA